MPALHVESVDMKVYFAFCMNKPFDFVSDPVKLENVS